MVGVKQRDNFGMQPAALRAAADTRVRQPEQRDMALSETQRAQVTKRLTAFCDARVLPAVRDKLRLGFRIRGNEVVLVEERPAFQSPHEWREMAVAKFKYVGTQGQWRLYCQHRDLRWHE